MGIPILYIHKGYCPYLRLSILQARKTNPEARIVLLGDKENECLKELGIDFYFFQNYFSFAAAFEKIYQHHSSNGYPYEVFCFQRWFILKDFVAQENINGYFLYNDSDTFLFCDVNALISKFVTRYDMSICGPIAPCFVFFKDASVLSEFCDFISHQYTEPQRYKTMVENYQNRQVKNIGELHVMFETISDMTMLGLFYRENPDRIIDLCDYKTIQSGIFEENHYLGFHNHYKGRFPLGRRIVWKQKQPHYVTYQSKLVPVLGFHFQGHAKREMFRVFRGNWQSVPTREYWMHQRKYYRFLLATCKKLLLKRLLSYA